MRTDDEYIADLTALVTRLDARIVELEHTYQMQRCPNCNATWEAPPDNTGCPWCEEVAERTRKEARAELLWPPFINTGDHCHAGDGTWLDHTVKPDTVNVHSALCGYDHLTDIDKAVWRHTRGSDEGSFTAWAQQLAHAVAAGTITEAEAKLALERAGKAIAAA